MIGRSLGSIGVLFTITSKDLDHFYNTISYGWVKGLPDLTKNSIWYLYRLSCTLTNLYILVNL